MQFTVLTFIFLLSVSVSNSAIACMMTEKEKVSLFKEFDDNKDGKISLEEYVMHEGQRVFKDVPIDREFLTKRHSEQMDLQKKGFVGLDQFSPINLQKCM